MLSTRVLFLCLLQFVAGILAVDPEDVYDGGYDSKHSPVQLRIGNGGAGQSGLVKELADAFIKSKVDSGSAPFKVAWYKSDTTVTINYLKDGIVDVGITYSPVAERISIKHGIAESPSYYAFRDHFMLIGPPSNPAKLSGDSDIADMFSKMHDAAEAGNTKPPVRFLSRYDKSATNIKEAELWLSIGQVPWATAYSTWYHQYITFPIQALTAAILLREYTITDYGTYLSIPRGLRDQMVIYKKGTNDADDPLLNPAHLLVGARAKNAEMAKEFAKWLVSKEGGQKVIEGFKKDGQQLYSPAPYRHI
ncbi:extracellular tungstate binding protein, putative [Coccidioides posadasii C735 delta SOWgp]|uniref:PBP domain-containing protein n=2 Tax=Coccidioides posadasii TaxID=199306 RepID=A0A0J6FC27_COCPO|nr:extracellular tungstate binding protein, putative [Coccidioides posadasii C735 delta SOWgp]EER29155.1 extracellular tungstate binding protein, putative [Coccidioides posadasii C735 delta SOWgp]KMM70581.1 hypothetical protein CPAG_06892 [Coccidioides posadasii RMSCC 3488]|eukprot:XP_003071300.1 extracellular tungstate binding protein, putative [Coccidioides posadasii C735 delta SOWgp]